MAHINRISLVSLLALGLAMPAMAQNTEAGPQTAPQPSADNDRDRDVVVITANKREETVQDIAVAVTAVTSQQKEEFGIISVTDLTNVTPGLSYTPGNERVTLRGIGRLTNSFGADPGVANYNDGIYTQFAVFAGKDPLLIDRVEVLRGPQGTLYGRNAIGGAINTISKRPSDDLTIDAVFGAGDFEYAKAGVAVSGPITDWLRYRVAAFRESREGIDLNYGNNETEGWEIDDKYLEVQLEGEIGDQFSWWLKWVPHYSYDKAGPPGGRTATFSTAPYLPGVFQAGGQAPRPDFAYGNPSVISFTQGGTRQDNPFATDREHAYNQNFASTAQLQAYDEFVVEGVYDAGSFDIKYMGGYVYYDYHLFTDSDGTPIDSITYNSITSQITAGPCAAAGPRPLLGFPTSTLTSVGAGGCIAGTAPKTIYPSFLNEYRESPAFFSNEINLISTHDGPLQWIAGLYQYQANSTQPGQQQFLPNEPIADFIQLPGQAARPNPDRRFNTFSNTSLFNAYGVFGQVDYSFNDQWKATLGLRWSKDTKDSKEEAFLACYIICRAAFPGVTTDYVNLTPIAFGAVPGATVRTDGWVERRLEGSWEAVTGNVGLEYRPLDDTLLFAKYSRGYKAGGFNNLGFGAAPYTDPEFVDAFEGGWKQEWEPVNLTTNAAVFFYTYKDAQAPLSIVTNPGGSPQTAFTAFVNVPEVETYGFELESNWNPIDPLNIGFTYAYLSTEIASDEVYVDSTRDARCFLGGATSGPAGTCSAVNTRFVDPMRSRSLEGNQLSQSPEHKVSANLSYQIDMQDGSYWLPTVSYSWRDEFYDTFFNNENETSPAYDNLDARLNWYSADGVFAITAWVRNALDEEQTTSISASGFRTADLSRYQTWSFAPPRMIGIDFKFHFE